MKIIENIPYSHEEDQFHLLDVYLPDVNIEKTIVFFHGGGLVEGDKKDNLDVFKYLVQKGFSVISVNYRMYPKASYPDFIFDSAEAVKWIIQNIDMYGYGNMIYITGISAGAYISMMLCFNSTFLEYFSIKPEKISGYIFDSGQPTTHFKVLHEIGLDERRVIIDEKAPIYHIQEGINYPPMLIIVSEHDIPNRLEQTQLLCSTLNHFGYANIVKMILMKGYHHTQYCHDVNLYGEIIYDFLK